MNFSNADFPITYIQLECETFSGEGQVGRRPVKIQKQLRAGRVRVFMVLNGNAELIGKTRK